MQLQPSIQLAGLVKHYLFLEAHLYYEDKLRLFPDGNTGIVFSERNKLLVSLNGKTAPQQLPHAFLYGQIGAFKDLYSTGETSLLIVVLRPFAIYQLLGSASSTLRDTVIDIEDLFGLKGINVQHKLAETADIHEKIRIIEKFLLQLLVDYQHNLPAIIPACINYISLNKGLGTVKELIQFSGYSERQLERLFNTVVGVSPNSFMQIIKLHNFLKELKKSDATRSLTRLCHHSGYYDQAHLIRSFKKVTGLTPSHYIKNNNPLAVNLLQI
jgi:AraC-like DNA-binding protein